LLGFLAIAASAIGGLELVKKISVPFFHGVTGLMIFLLPFFVAGKQAAKDFWWVGIACGLIGLGGIALAFLSAGSQLLFFSPAFVMLILTPLIMMMTLAFTYGFINDIKRYHLFTSGM
jgi:hypothetical protein